MYDQKQPEPASSQSVANGATESSPGDAFKGLKSWPNP